MSKGPQFLIKRLSRHDLGDGEMEEGGDGEGPQVGYFCCCRWFPFFPLQK